MKISTSLCIAATLWAATMAVPAGGQSLGAIARKERAKRAHQPKAAKVYTNDNIPHVTTVEPAAPAQTPAATSPSGAPAAAPAANSENRTEAEKGESKEGTQAEWQAKFKAARSSVAQAEERAQLDENEANLLQMRVTRELDPNTKSQLRSQLDAKQAAVQESQAALAKAKDALDQLEEEFKASGAPEDWSKTD
jgi:hypothetical protein